MAATKKLAKFAVTRSGDGFDLHVEDEAGQVLEIGATRDQVDVIADTLDELLSEDESADEVEDDEMDDDEVEDDGEAEGGIDGEKR